MSTYELISHDTARQLHDNFMAGIEKKVKAVIPEDMWDKTEMMKHVKRLLIAAARKKIEIKQAELAEIVKNGKDAIVKRETEIEKKLHSENPGGYWNSPKFSALQMAKRR